MKVHPRRGMTMLAAVATIAMAAVAGRPAAAESLSGKYTRKDEMNAVRIGGGVYTIHDLIDRRAQAPGRFDHFNNRLGQALSLGVDGLNAKRALAPGRFDFFHPCLAYLLRDTAGPIPDGGIGGVGQPDTLPEILVPPTDEAVPPPPPAAPSPGGPGIGSSGGPTPAAPLVPPITPPALPQLPTPPGALTSPPGPGVPPPPGEQPLIPTQVIPEPPGLLQLGVGLAGLFGVLAWRRRPLAGRPALAPSA